MRYKIIMFFLLFSIQSNNQSYAQNCNIKEVIINYSDGKEICHVCTTEMDLSYDSDLKYFWYTEFSGIKSTKGGVGGYVLNGQSNYYNKEGSLMTQDNFYYGLLHGMQKKWDDQGELVAETTYAYGELKKEKYRLESGWREETGKFFQKGYLLKFFNEKNKTTEEKYWMEDFMIRDRHFNPENGNLTHETTSLGVMSEQLVGKHLEFYDNGKPKVKGQYLDEYCGFSIMVGVWEFYANDGTLKTYNYKPETANHPNGNKKIRGEWFFLEDENKWIKSGIWRWYDEEEKLEREENYNEK